LFVLAKAGDGSLVSIMVEGKVNEPFGNPVGTWKASGDGFTLNKQERLAGLTALVGLSQTPDYIYYQLLHRIASAVIAAQTFNAKYAIMLVHSFSSAHTHWDAFADFVSLYGKTAQPERLIELTTLDSINLFAGWASSGINSVSPHFSEEIT
jgi:hypothetical protein